MHQGQRLTKASPWICMTIKNKSLEFPRRGLVNQHEILFRKKLSQMVSVGDYR
jgi:hypothetical protein